MNKLKFSRQVFTMSKRLKDRSFHVVQRTRTAVKCTKMKSARVQSV